MVAVITLPHGKPNEGDGFDEGAIEFVSQLDNALRARVIEYEILVGKTNREFVDLNRTESQNHEWFDKVREVFAKATIHIDIHSFPHRDETAIDEESMTSTGYDLREWSLADIVLFRTPEITDNQFLDDIDSRLQEIGISVGIEEGGFENYVHALASVLFDLPSLVVELNEGSSKEFDAIADRVADSLENYLSEPAAEV